MESPPVSPSAMDIDDEADIDHIPPLRIFNQIEDHVEISSASGIIVKFICLHFCTL